jgi:hypothetical protein
MDSEVYRARSKKDTTVVALKKILMHHEKEGVSGHPQPFHDHN